MKIEKLEKELREKNIDVAKLGVFYLSGADIFIGENLGNVGSEIAGGIVLKNPRRMLRLQRMTQQGLEIQTLVGDVEGQDGIGTLSIVPRAGYQLSSQTNATKQHIYELLLTYFQARIIDKAAKAGIITPPQGFGG